MVVNDCRESLQSRVTIYLCTAPFFTTVYFFFFVGRGVRRYYRFSAVHFIMNASEHKKSASYRFQRTSLYLLYVKTWIKAPNLNSPLSLNSTCFSFSFWIQAGRKQLFLFELDCTDNRSQVPIEVSIKTWLHQAGKDVLIVQAYISFRNTFLRQAFTIFFCYATVCTTFSHMMLYDFLFSDIGTQVKLTFTLFLCFPWGYDWFLQKADSNTSASTWMAGWDLELTELSVWLRSPKQVFKETKPKKCKTAS